MSLPKKIKIECAMGRKSFGEIYDSGLVVMEGGEFSHIVALKARGSSVHPIDEEKKESIPGPKPTGEESPAESSLEEKAPPAEDVKVDYAEPLPTREPITEKKHSKRRK